MFKRLNIIKGIEKEQLYLFPVNVMEWLPENDVVYVILSILDLLDLFPIPDPPKKMEIISVQSVLFLSKTSEMCSNPL